MTETTQKVLALTLYKFSTPIAMFQSWILGFDPRKLIGLMVLVWILLRLLPLEYLEFARMIAGQIGQVLKEDNKVMITEDLRFCIELKIDKGWIATLELPNLSGRRVKVVIDYDDYMCCQLYFDTFHGISNCSTLMGHLHLTTTTFFF